MADRDSDNPGGFLDERLDTPRPVSELRNAPDYWYDRWPQNIASMVYGDNATMQQSQGIKHLLGTANPLNLPGQVHEGSNRIAEGYRRGDLGQMAGGALEFAGGAAPFVGPAARGVGNVTRSLGPAPKLPPVGPWGSNSAAELEAFRSARPMPVLNDINAPVVPKQEGPISANLAGARYGNAVDEAKAFMQRPTEMDLYADGKGYEKPINDGQRWSYRDTDGQRFTETGKREALAEDLLSFGARNENVPGAYEKAVRLNDDLQRTGKQHDESFWREYKDRQAINKEWEPAHESYDKFYDKLTRGRGETHGIGYMDGDEYMNILETYHGADPKVPGSVAKANKEFWASEQAKLKAGQKTRHHEASERQQQENDALLEQQFGVKINDANRNDIYRRWEADMTERIGNLKSQVDGMSRSSELASYIPDADSAFMKHAVRSPGYAAAAYIAKKTYDNAGSQPKRAATPTEDQRDLINRRAPAVPGLTEFSKLTPYLIDRLTAKSPTSYPDDAQSMLIYGDGERKPWRQDK